MLRVDLDRCFRVARLRLRSLAIVGVVCLMVSATISAACGGRVGSCVGTGGVIDSCKEEWTEDECDDWDAQEVNGSTWTWNRKPCDDLGYTATCPDGTHLLPADASSCG